MIDDSDRDRNGRVGCRGLYLGVREVYEHPMGVKWSRIFGGHRGGSYLGGRESIW